MNAGIVSEPTLLPISPIRPDAELLRFNYQISQWALPERLTVLHPHIHKVLKSSPGPQGARWLSRMVLEKWNLPEPFCFNINQQSRLALLPPNVLTRLADQVGILLYAPVIQTAISRDDRKKVLEMAGSQWRQFAVTRLPFLRSRLTPLHQSELGQSVLGDSDVVFSKIQQAGWIIVLTCIDSDSPAVIKRLELKLPLEVSLPDRPEVSACDAWAVVKRLIKMDWPQEWVRCFS